MEVWIFSLSFISNSTLTYVKIIPHPFICHLPIFAETALFIRFFIHTPTLMYYSLFMFLQIPHASSFMFTLISYLYFTPSYIDCLCMVFSSFIFTFITYIYYFIADLLCITVLTYSLYRLPNNNRPLNQCQTLQIINPIEMRQSTALPHYVKFHLNISLCK